jgi:hypothetical protein
VSEAGIVRLEPSCTEADLARAALDAPLRSD